MFKKIVSLILCICLVAVMALSLTACKGDKSNEYPVTIGDVTIQDEPLNIVVLSDCFADIVSYIGYDVKMVGRSVEIDQEFLSVVPLVGTASAPNTEAIISSETDLVITEQALPENVTATLTDAGVQVLTLKKPTSFEELSSLYVNLGTVLGGNVTGKEKGKNAYDELTGTMSDFKNAIPSNVVKTACYLYFNENYELCTLTSGSIEHEFFSYCGAINVFDDQETELVDLELLKISTPTYIFYDDEAVLTYLSNDSELANMSALSNGNTMQVKKTQFSRMGTTYEELIYKMIEFMFIEEATADEATPDSIDETVQLTSENTTVIAE
ncbi:MAG: ABC transporter substrate-binding protein [Ruminococcus sp.]|nr:ABC transporter substrate-binding protein [Ruminococcus sp.]